MTSAIDTSHLYDSYRPPRRLPEPHPAPADRTRGSSTGGDLFTLVANRLGYGPRSGDRAAWNALGANDADRLAAYVAQQLNPASIADTDYESRRAASNHSTVIDIGHRSDPIQPGEPSEWVERVQHRLAAPGGHQNQLWIDYIETSGADRDRPQEDTELDWFQRTIYSKRQLEARMIEFWTDHFNVYSDEWPTYAVWPTYVDGLRALSFGKFRDLLKFVSEHPAMLYYLDQYTSSTAGPNENYLRDTFELHAMGAEHYLGTTKPPAPASPPAWPTTGPLATLGAEVAGEFPLGIQAGYYDNDVFDAADAFSGYTYEDSSGPNGGLFFFDINRHAVNQSYSVLGFNFTNISSSVPAQNRGPMILDMLAYHPGTAIHVCRKLCRRFVGDTPPDSLVHSAALVFLQERHNPDQMKLVMEHILSSSEFEASFGDKMKRPFEIAVSMIRAVGADFDWNHDGDETGSFFWRYERTGHRPFRWRPPDGFPDVRGKWETAAPRVMTWRLAQWMCSVRDVSETWFMDVDARTPAQITRSPAGLANYWIHRLFEREDPFEGEPVSGIGDPAFNGVVPESMPSGFHDEVIAYLGQGFGPDIPLNLASSDIQERLQMMLALLMSTPEFCEK